jgi:two-component system response regulator NreC
MSNLGLPTALGTGLTAGMPDSDAIRLVLVDDHEVVRGGLRRVLEAQPGWSVEAEAGDIDRALRAVLGHKPDVLILDLNLGGVSSLEYIPALLERSPGMRVVVLTMQTEPGYARDALRAGASAYVLKEAAEDELVTAVKAAAEGRTYLNPRVGAMLAAEPAESETDGGLTRREREILRLLALGHTNGEIADQLFLSQRTIETHRASIQRKLDLSTRAELTRYAMKHKLL